MESGLAAVILILVLLAFAGGAVTYWAYRRVLRRAKGIERGLKMVPLEIHLPAASQDTATEGRDIREVVREKIGVATTMYDLIAGVAQSGFKSRFYGQRHLAFEIVATGSKVHYYAAVPVALVSVVKQALVTAYPGAQLEEVEDHNIFNEAGKIGATVGGELVLKENTAYPIATYKQIDSDPMQALLNPLSELQDGDGVGVQIMLRPAGANWTKQALDLVRKKRQAGHADLKFTAKDLVKAAVKVPDPEKPEPVEALTNVELAMLESVEEKTKHPGFETLIRLLVSSNHPSRSDNILRGLTSAFALFDAPGLNGFKFLPTHDPAGLATAFIFRFFPPEIRSTILNSEELATVFHLPEAQFTASSGVERQPSKQVDGPAQLPTAGLRLGYNLFRGAKKDILLGTEDRRRHTYIVGQTGTGKSTLLENLAVQDMLAGNGLAFIDPHGDTTERLISMIPKARAEDVIYFNPADTESPMGLNLFEFQTPEQKDFLIQETINMLYKLYDPGHTGIIGPRYEHWYRNAALTLMSDPAGATFIEIPKVFTDSDYLKQKFKYVTDPTVVDFWTKEMGQTSDYHKSEMLGWFVSKFGAFMSNEMMRNIIGQTKSAFNLREVMDKKKILLVNLSKGQTGELNSQLLGMIFVMKFQAAAMSRAAQPEADRTDFCLYVDEFQNFSTDSFASILSEARKYRLNLIVANQFIGQLSQSVREAVFGNVGTVISYRTGPEDADFLVKQFAPIFDAQDLVNLPNFQAVIRLMIGGLPSQPFSLSALPPVGVANPEMGTAIKQLSAAKYGHPRSQVETEIFGRLQGQVQSVAAPTPNPTPSLATPSPSEAPIAPSSTVPGVPQPAPITAALNQPPAAPAPIEPKPDRAQASSSNELSISDIVKNVQEQAERNVPIPKPPPEPTKPPVLTTGSDQNQAQAEIDKLLGVKSPSKPPIQATAPSPVTPPPAPTPIPVAPAPISPSAPAKPSEPVSDIPVAPNLAPPIPVVPLASLPVKAPAASIPSPKPVSSAPPAPPTPSPTPPAQPLPKPTIAPAPKPEPTSPAETRPAGGKPSPSAHQSKPAGQRQQPSPPAKPLPRSPHPEHSQQSKHPKARIKVIQPPVHHRPKASPPKPAPTLPQTAIPVIPAAVAPPSPPPKPRFTINAQPLPAPVESAQSGQPKSASKPDNQVKQPQPAGGLPTELAQTTASASEPKLPAGEVRVDENGNVIMA